MFLLHFSHEMMMKNFHKLLWLAAFITPAHADPLSATDMEQIREKLKSVMNDAREKATARYTDAAQDFLAGMQSDTAALDLYVKCIAKADFEDQDRKEAEFSEWKRAFADHLRNDNFRQALRHQLHWLVISMRASAHPDQLATISTEAEKVLEGIFKNMEPKGIDVKEPKTKWNHDDKFSKEPLLEKKVLESAFARAYKLGDLKIENWPASPFNIGEIYDRAIMPPLRNPENLAKLAQAWDTRIAMIQKKNQYTTGYTDEKAKHMQESSRLESFATDALPDLQWQKEMDLFQAGDQKAGAVRMLKHIEENLANDKARTWVEQFQALMQPKAPGQ